MTDTTPQTTGPYLNQIQAAAYLGIKPKTLQRYRLTGAGPTYRKHGACVRYAVADLDAWSQSRRRRRTQGEADG